MKNLSFSRPESEQLEVSLRFFPGASNDKSLTLATSAAKATIVKVSENETDSPVKTTDLRINHEQQIGQSI